MSTIRIPTPLRAFTGGQTELAVEGVTVRAALDDLLERHAELRGRILDDQGELRRFVNVFVGSTDIRRLAGLDTPLEPGAELVIVPAVAGGRS
jgi:molybdopterin converting factor small subunit